MPQVGIAVSRHRENLARLTEEIEGHQHENEDDQNREAAGQEQLDHVPGQLARREEAEVDHASPNLGTRPRMSFATRAKNHSSAPIGWPPGLCASTWYIHGIIEANSTSGTHKARIGLSSPFAPACSPY